MLYAIIEDEPYSSELLEFSMNKLYPSYKLVFKAATISKTVEYLKKKPELDLIFMDIELGDGNSFEIFKEVDVQVPVIFTTSYNEYTLQAFKVHSIDYLLKPFSDNDLTLAVTKFERYYRNSGNNITSELIQKLAAPARKPMRIRMEVGDSYKFFNADEAAYFISEDKYVLAALSNGHRVITNFSKLQDVEDMLPASEFFRISRNIVASIDSIKSVKKFFRGRLLVTITAGEKSEQVIISSTRRDAFLDWLGN